MIAYTFFFFKKKKKKIFFFKKKKKKKKKFDNLIFSEAYINKCQNGMVFIPKLYQNYMQINFKNPFIFYFLFFWIVWLLHTAHSQLISTNLRSSSAFRAQFSRLFPWVVLRNGSSGVFKVYLHIVFV